MGMEDQFEGKPGERFERVGNPDVGGQKMWKRLNWSIEMIEKIFGKKLAELPMELQIKALEVGISLYIQSERR